MIRAGFHTNAFVWAGLNDIEKIASIAKDMGFSFLEVGPGIPLDARAFEKAGRIIDFEAFIYCRNFVDELQERQELYRRMEFASSLGVRRMNLSTGISRALSLPPSGGCNPLLSLEEAARFLEEALEKAEKLDMELCLENCPMCRNIATSPYMFDRIFGRVDSPRLNLCYDASHFVWQMIDAYEPLVRYRDRIHHVHLKDTCLDRNKLAEVGILHNTGADMGHEENQWWWHTVIGGGEINWERFLSMLDRKVALSFEMEDYRYERDVEKVKEGLTLQLGRLESYLNPRP